MYLDEGGKFSNEGYFCEFLQVLLDLLFVKEISGLPKNATRTLVQY